MSQPPLPFEGDRENVADLTDRRRQWLLAVDDTEEQRAAAVTALADYLRARRERSRPVDTIHPQGDRL